MHIALPTPHSQPASSEEHFLLKRSNPSVYSQHLAEHQETPGRQGCLINRSWGHDWWRNPRPLSCGHHPILPIPAPGLHDVPARARGPVGGP